jgi:acyl-CoA thioesterase
MRVVAAADFGNGVSRVLDFTRHLFINPDLTVYLHRRPRGEWIALDAETFAGGNGVGLAQSRLFDRDGYVGTSLQALLLDARTP